MVNTNTGLSTDQELPPPYSVDDPYNCKSIITLDYDHNIHNISFPNNNKFSEITEDIIFIDHKYANKNDTIKIVDFDPEFNLKKFKKLFISDFVANELL